MACKYCQGGANYDDFHDICQSEFSRRVTRAVCVRCGGDKDTTTLACSKCADMADPPYLGYPGG